MAMSVVDFDQWVTDEAGNRHSFVCVVTIVWKRDGGPWKCLRRHLTVMRRA